MTLEKEKRYEEIRRSLTQLDLHHLSLENMGQKLASKAAKSFAASSGTVHQQSLQLSNDCSRIIHDLCDHLDREHLDSCESALNKVDLAVHRASQAKTPTLCMVNVWRVVEAIDQFLAGIADKYGYVRLSEEMAFEPTEEKGSKAAELDKLFEEYEEAMATKTDTPMPAGPPFSRGILRWRGSQLFYVERVEDGARWIELDPDYETEAIPEEDEAVELAEARTIEGYSITLRLDLRVDENEVDSYIRSQKGSEYFVLGSQVASEQGKSRGMRGRRL